MRKETTKWKKSCPYIMLKRASFIADAYVAPHPPVNKDAKAKVKA
jgi:hypothetical protein